MIREYRTEKIVIGESITIDELNVFLGTRECMIIDPLVGTSLCAKKNVAENLIKKQISNDLAFALLQRAMAHNKNGRPYIEVKERQHPDFFLIDITKKCNLGCVYCFRTQKDDIYPMTEDTLLHICQVIASYSKERTNNRFSIQLWGGEPILKLDHIVKVREMFDHLDVHPELSIETNGVLITKEIARILKQKEINVGVSIDGDAIIQNLQRPQKSGSGSYEQVKAGIEALQDCGIYNFGTITVVTKNTYKRIEEILDHLIKDLHIVSLKFNLLRGNENLKDFEIVEEEIDDFLNRLINKLRDLYREGYVFCENNISQRLRNLLIRPNDNICNSKGCQGGFRMLSIDSEGNVFPCEMTDVREFRIGSVFDEGKVDFSEMVLNASKNNHGYFAERETERCVGCAWWYYCRGGCKSSVFFEQGNVSSIDRFQCAYNKALYKKLVELVLEDRDFAIFLMNNEDKTEIR